MENFRQVHESSSGVPGLDVLIIADTDFRFATFTVGTSSRGMSDGPKTRFVQISSQGNGVSSAE
jgi:hypothetical protein